jgi:alkanesulfonate monooxygenase SsuD/methylene tetrahydromethanopterin reductase-like flavin-dependent oxidoreductase (luciferase family)
MPRTPKVPVLVSTLGEKAFQLAGEVADGALSWVCPVQYLLRTGIPALRASAAAVGRAAPPLVAHVPVALSENRDSVLAAGHQMLDFYATIPFYASMFANAGFPSTPNQQAMSDDLVEGLVIWGTGRPTSLKMCMRQRIQNFKSPLAHGQYGNALDLSWMALTLQLLSKPLFRRKIPECDRYG